MKRPPKRKLSSDRQELADLRRCLEKIVPLTSLPALCIGCSPATILARTAETLVTILDAQIIYLSVSSDPADMEREDAICAGGQKVGTLENLAPDVRERLRTSLASQEAECGEVFGPTGRLATYRLPFAARPIHGEMVVASSSPGFPQATDRFLAQIAGNQVAISLREARLGEDKKHDDERAASAAGQAIIGRMGFATQMLLDPEQIERTAADLIGNTLSADRCFYAHLDPDNDFVRLGAGWNRKDLPAISGEYRLSGFGVSVEAMFDGGQTVVIHDSITSNCPDKTVALLDLLEIASALGIPLYRGGRIVSLLCVTMDQPRRWSEEETALAGSLAGEMRAAMDSAATVKREHQIASTLQEALIPPIPSAWRGIDLAAHYLATLEESFVGGDFYTAYPVDEARLALVIGDVSGKGLAAAAQVSSLLNMLKYALFSSASVSDALSGVNRLAYAQGLLSGFATVFAGIYSLDDSTLRYVSCGHEPVLVRRANDDIEELYGSGPPIGVAEGYVYREHAVELGPEDVLLMYTDGLSEAKRRRGDLFGTEGVSKALLRAPKGSAADLVRSIVSEATQFASKGFRDDVCVLAALLPRF